MDKETLVRQLDEGFKVLTYDEKVVLQLFYYEDLNYAEISEVLSKDIGEVGILLSMTKTKMRSYTDVFDKIDGLTQRGMQLMKM